VCSRSPTARCCSSTPSRWRSSIADRLIFHHKRAKTLVVARSASIAAPLPTSLAAVEAEIAGALQASRAAAKRRQA